MDLCGHLCWPPLGRSHGRQRALLTADTGHVSLTINSFSDEEGGLNRHPMIPTWPLELLSVFRFTEHDGRTTFTLEWAPLDATAEECEMFASGHVHMTQGWSGTLEQLEAHLAQA